MQLFLSLHCFFLLGSTVTAVQSTIYTVDLTSQNTTAFPRRWEGSVGSGHATLSLRSDWRQHLTRVRSDLGVKRTRFHGLLDDDFSLSLGPGDDSYINLDSMVDFHLSIGMEPLFEVSFMPSWMASNTSANNVMHYKGNSSPPKNMTEFGLMIGRMGAHLSSRYPNRTFMFEVWNEPVRTPAISPDPCIDATKMWPWHGRRCPCQRQAASHSESLPTAWSWSTWRREQACLGTGPALPKSTS